MPDNLRDELVAKRQARVAKIGHAEGAEVPRRRETPILPFPGDGGLVCEIKRRSPSQGVIAPDLDAARLAGACLASGVRAFSVVTESRGFGGRPADVLHIKRNHPDAAVMRRDFLYDIEDLDIAWRTGADAVLLVPGIMTGDRLAMLHRCARSLGLEVAVTVNRDEDLRKAAPFRPRLVVLGGRDPETLAVDFLRPLRLREGVDWEAEFVFEDGVGHPDQAAFAAGAGFRHVLSGRAVVEDPALAQRLAEAVRRARPARFWPEIARRAVAGGGRPLVKICGIAREEDALLAADLGADVLGFVFHGASPRNAGPDLPRSLRDVPVLKVAVTAPARDAAGLDPALRHLLEDGLLDAVQFDGDADADACSRLWPVHYRVFRPGTAQEAAEDAGRERCPRLLLDAPGGEPGESSRRVMPEVLESWRRPLWLSGGVTPDNAPRIAQTRRPELLDIGVGVEEAPGRKSPEKLRRLFKELAKA